MELYAIAFDFNCHFNFSKALVRYNDYEFVFHNGKTDKVDVIETILSNSDERDKFAQTAIDFCLSLVAKNIFCSFSYIAEFAMGLKKSLDLLNKKPSIRISRNDRSSILDINSIKKLETDSQKIVSSLLNDADYNNNPFFKFLCYWKILEVPINSKTRRAERWINDIINSNPDIISNNKDIKQKHNSGVDIGRYFKEQNRNAIAHISRPPYLSSHNYQHFRQVSKACNEIYDFVNYFVQNEIFWKKGLKKTEILSIIY